MTASYFIVLNNRHDFDLQISDQTKQLFMTINSTNIFLQKIIHTYILIVLSKRSHKSKGFYYCIFCSSVSVIFFPFLHTSEYFLQPQFPLLDKFYVIGCIGDRHLELGLKIIPILEHCSGFLLSLSKDNYCSYNFLKAFSLPSLFPLDIISRIDSAAFSNSDQKN